MEDKIREAIEVVKACTPVKIENQSITVDMLRDSFNCLVELAELYLSVSKDMPKVEKTCANPEYTLDEIHDYYVARDARNQVIKEVTIVTTKLLAEKDAEIAQLKTAIDEAVKKLESVKDRLLSEGEIKKVLTDLEDQDFIEIRNWYCCKVDKEMLIKAIYQAQQEKMEGV